MIENYYEILNLKPNASMYKIALRSKKMSKSLLGSVCNSEESQIKMYQLTRGIEVLKDEDVKKYYDILYRIFILKEMAYYRDEIIEKYLGVLDSYLVKGNERAEKIINNPKCRLTAIIKRPLVIQYFLALLQFYSPKNFTFFIIFLIGIGYLVWGLTSVTDFGLGSMLVASWTCLYTFWLQYSNFKDFAVDWMGRE